MWKRGALYSLPVLLCVIVHWYGFLAWFQQDDFAWLGVSRIAREFGWKQAFFAPYAQGTVRLFSERLFFFTFFELFGLNALPYKLVIFGTQILNLMLLVRLGGRLSGRPLTGFVAACVWAVHVSLAWPLIWTCAYNQILLSTCFLGALLFLIRYCESGRARDNAWQWAIHLFGYGVLEANVVYPAVAVTYAALFARHRLKTTVWLLVPAVAYTALHFLLLQKHSSGVYAVEPWAAPRVFLEYLFLASWPDGVVGAVHYLAAGVLIAYTVWRIRRHDKVAAFGASWFAIAVLPYLSLPGHISEYYLTVPAIGISLLLATAQVPVLAAILVFASIPYTLERTTYHYTASMKVRDLVLGVRDIHRAHPGRTILLAGVDDELFRNAVYDHAFRLTGAKDVYLVPENARRLTRPASLRDLSDYTLPPGELRALLDAQRAVVYLIGYDRIRNVTQAYRSGRLLPILSN